MPKSIEIVPETDEERDPILDKAVGLEEVDSEYPFETDEDELDDSDEGFQKRWYPF